MRNGDKKKLKDYRLLEIILIILLAIISETNFSFQASVQKVIFLMMACIAVIYYAGGNRKGIYDKIFVDLIYMSVPFLIAFVYTLIIVVCNNQFQLNIRTQAFTTTMYAVVQMCFAAAILYIYKEKAVDLVFWYIVCSYCITIFLTLKHLGEAPLSNLLERNDVGTAVVPLMLFYIFLIAYEKCNIKSNYIKIFILMVIFILCGKRSAFVGFMIGVLVVFFLSINLKNKIKFCKGVGIVVLVILFAYVIVVHSGILEDVCDILGITTQGRLYVWRWFRDQYSISPFYFGKGLQYIHLYMEAGIAEYGSKTSMVTNFGYLHNSILQIFIELGFFGFFLWFIFLLQIYPRRIRKEYGVSTYYLAMILIISMVFLFMTDNVLTYPVYQTTMYIALFSYPVFKYEKERKN